MSDYSRYRPLRTIRCDASVEKSTEIHEQKGRRQQDQVHEIEWRFARRSEDVDAIGGKGLYVLVSPGQVHSEPLVKRVSLTSCIHCQPIQVIQRVRTN